MYQFVKKLLPLSLRQSLRPLYERWGLRNFTKPQTIELTYGACPYKLCIDPANGAVDQYLYLHRIWEPQILRRVMECVSDGSVFIDVGANIGAFAVPVAVCGGSVKVHAFEPLPRLANQIRTSAKLNKAENVIVHNIALGADESTVNIKTSRQNIGGSSIVNKNEGKGDVLSVAQKTLDAVLGTAERIDLIKIDVEGYEYEVLKGASQIIKKHHPALIIEFSPQIYQYIDEFVAHDLLTFLNDCSYVVHDIDNDCSVDSVDEYLTWLGIKQTNLYCTYDI